MSSENTATTSKTCSYPGCGQPAKPAGETGRPSEYCEDPKHTKVSAWRERKRLQAEQAGAATTADTDRPVSHARVTGAELLRSLRGEADRLAGIARQLSDAAETMTDPMAAEAEVEAIRAEAAQRATTAEARAAAAERRAAEADQWRAEADAAAEEMATQLAGAQRALAEARAAREEAEADRDAAVRRDRKSVV